MKVTVVPAQVTTVEDRIAGNLGLSQLLLLAAPVFGGSALYVILPPTMHSSTYKLVAMILFLLVCSLMAIRIKGKILLFWLIVILRYNLRSRYYVFNKHSLHGREQYKPAQITLEQAETEPQPVKIPRQLPLSTAEVAELQNLIDNPASKLSFETRKGYLYVRITEVK